MSDKVPKKISAKEIMQDLKTGMTDAKLMEKYHISFQGLQDLFGKLIQAGLATKTYFEKRALTQTPSKPKETGSATCPYCGFKAAEEFRECPQCRQDVSEWLDTMELTKILTGSFE